MKNTFEVVCNDCGTTFKIGSTAYYNHARNSHIKFRCKSCKMKYYAKLNKERWNNKTPEEKQNFSKKMSDIYNNQSEKEKQIHREKSIAYWKNISEEDLRKYSLECKERWNSKSEEDKNKFIQNLRSQYNEWRSKLSDKEKQNLSVKISNANKHRWNNMSKEEHRRMIDMLKNARDEWWSNATNEQLKLHKEKSIQYWNNLSPEDKEKYRQSKIKEWNNLDNYIDICFKCASGKVNSDLIQNKQSPAEIEFINQLNLCKIDYKFQYTNTTYPDFFYDIYDRTKSPFHVWDFYIKTSHKNILVDIDGSEHTVHEGEFITKDGIDVGKKIQENDSKRPYQTDGLDAYIILAYDDVISKDTPVCKIQNNTFITFNEFMNYLNFENTYYEEIKKIIKEDLS